jgi:hypothetical protein
MYVFINYKQNAKPDHNLAVELEKQLRDAGYNVFRDESRLKGGSRWPKEILQNLERADVMLSLISNASMKSAWVLNEIDEAVRLRKAVIPIMLEELDNDLNFMSYRPRFPDIQYIVFKGESTRLWKEVLEALQTLGTHVPRWSVRHSKESIAKILVRHGIDDPIDVLSYFASFMQEFHVVFAAAAEIDKERGYPRLIGDGTCRSLSESLAFAMQEYAAMYRHNYDNEKKRGGRHDSYWEERLKPSACLADMMSTMLEEWQPLVDQVKKSMEERKDG